MTRAQKKLEYADLRDLSPEQKHRLAEMMQDLPARIDTGDESAIIIALHATGKYEHSEVLALADHIAERARALRQARPDFREIIGAPLIAAAAVISPGDARAADLLAIAQDASWAFLPVAAIVAILVLCMIANWLWPIERAKPEPPSPYEKFRQ